MNEVIDLMDSEDEGETQSFQQPEESFAMSSWQRKPSPRKLHSTQVSHPSESYDGSDSEALGSDSDDSLEIVEFQGNDMMTKKPSPKKIPLLPPRVSLQPSKTNYDSDDSLEIVEIQQANKDSQFSSRKQSPKITPVNPYARPLRASFSNETKKPPVNPYARTPRASFSNETESMPRKRPPNPYVRAPSVSHDDLDSDSDSDSDDSLLMGARVFSRSAPSFSAAQSTATPANEIPGTNTTSSLAKPATRPAMFTSPQSEEVDAPFHYPTLLSTSKTYEDLRPKYILAFWRYARKRVQNSYDRAKLDQTCKKIVLLALSPHPIRSLEEYCFSRGVGGGSGASASDRNIRDETKKRLIQGGLDTNPMPTHDGKYTSIAEACLVAMCSDIERKLVQKGLDPRDLTILDDASLQIMLGEKDMWMSLQDLIPAIDRLLKPQCPARLTRAKDDDNGAAHYTTPTTRSAEFLQIAKLEVYLPQLGDMDEKVGRIKRHKLRGQTLFELTFLGLKSAQMVRSREFPASPGHYRCSKIQRMSQVKETFKGICLGVDFREGGGGHSVLHEMCNNLDRYKVPYFVGTMHIGDYVFFTKNATSSDYLLCPILVERKSIEDIALSIHDGRWRDQKQRMYIGQYVFGYENCKIVFIIEGKEEAQQVTHGYIGHRMYGVSIERVKAEIENLKSEGFEVIRTPSRPDTMRELGAWTTRVSEEMRAGVLTAQYTYSQFREEVKKIPQGTDFSRLAKDAVARKVKTAMASSASKRVYAEIDSDSDIEVLETLTPSTVSKKPIARSSIHAKTPSTDSKKPAKAASSDEQAAAKKAKNDSDPYDGWTAKQLKEKCVECGLTQSGTIAEIKARLSGIHPPKVWLRRKQAKQYVPSRHNVAATAILVALYLHEKDAGEDCPGMTSDELYVKAEELEITKNPFSGGTTQTGQYLYNGMASMKYLVKGDPALVIKSRGGQYKLTRSSELAGYPVAEAMHKWCHQHNNCPCGATDL